MGNAPQIIRRPRQSPPQSEIEKMLTRLLTGLTHGRITLVLQDGVIIQVNREESVRIAPMHPIEN